MGKKLKSIFWPTCRNPLHDFYGSTPKCEEVCALHVTGLDDAQENRNARRPSCNTQNRQNWYCVTNILAHPVETP